MNTFERVLHYYGYLDIELVKSKFKIMCPFHEDINPSLIIDLQKQSFFCFGCMKRGSVYEFVKDIEKLSGFDTLLKINQIVKSSESERVKIKQRVVVKDLDCQAAIDLAHQEYEEALKVNWLKLKNHYMFDRGFNAETLSRVNVKATFSTRYPVIFSLYDQNNFKGFLKRTFSKKIEKQRKYLYNKGFSRENSLIGCYERDWAFVVEGYL